MKEFHKTKPSKIFKGNNLEIYIESTYPVECFGEAKQYIAYLTVEKKFKALCAGDTKAIIIKELLRWKDNPFIYRLINNDIEQFKQIV